MLIAIAITIGFSLITLISGISYGSLESIKIKSGRYFSGNISVAGYIGRFAKISNPEEIIRVLKDTPLPLKTISGRIAYLNNDAELFFNGEKIRQRKLIGIDFATEGPEFSGLTFTEGSWENLATKSGKDGILISAPAARILGCRVGDDLTLYLTTDSGQYNTARLIINGIFNETSLFGYVAYMRQADLNRLLRHKPTAATDIAIYVKSGVNIEHVTESVRMELSKHFNVFPRLSSRVERDEQISRGNHPEETLAVLSQNAQLAQIKQLMDALLIVTYFILSVFTIIVMVGLLNTFRVLVHERRKEIGTLRALGMSRTQIRMLFLFEAIILSIVSSAIGLIFGLLLFRLCTIFDLSFIPAAGMFLEGGHLHFDIDINVLVINAIIMIAATILAVLDPSNKASRMEPAEAMRSTT